MQLKVKSIRDDLKLFSISDFSFLKFEEKKAQLLEKWQDIRRNRIVEWLWDSKLKSRASFLLILEFILFPQNQFKPLLILLEDSGEEFFQQYILQSLQFQKQADLEVQFSIREDVESMINLHAKPLAQKAFKEHFGSSEFLNFGPIPKDYVKHPIRYFKRWYSSYGFHVQGEHDEKGRMDGRVVSILPRGNIDIQRYKEGREHGHAIKINSMGTINIGEFSEGQRVLDTWKSIYLEKEDAFENEYPSYIN